MKTWALKDGDIYVEAGQIVWVSDGAEVAQTVKTRLSTFLGEYFYDQNFGIPYWQALNNTSNIEALNLALKRTIEGTVGVESIENFQSNITNRTYNVIAVIKTTYSGTITINKSYEYGS